MPYHVYIALCSDQTLYTGYTNHIENREKTHNEGRGAKYTRARLPIKIVYTESFQTRSQAMKREYAIKQLSKTNKLNLINKKTPQSVE
jgi:putative endonuclease